MLRLFVHVQVAWLLHCPAWLTRRSNHDKRDDQQDGERGQASAEYALVLLGAAAIALLVVAWATKTDKIGQLFDFVFDRIRRNSGT